MPPFSWDNLLLAKMLFWVGIAQCGWTFIFYPLIIQFLARIKSSDQGNPPILQADLPAITIIIAANNEESRICNRIKNLLQCDYPSSLLEILVVSDGSTDNTVGQLDSLELVNLKVIAFPEKSGKPACLNAAVKEASGDWLIFADSRQNFAPDALQVLSRHFSNSSVAAISGQLFPNTSEGGTARGIDFYWKMEKSLRYAESQVDSCIGCTGAIYALRKEFFQPIPEDTLLDDVIIPLQATHNGKRILFEPDAKAFDPQRLDPAVEKLRKARTLAGNFQMLFRYPGWLFPRENRLWWKLFSHKYSRLLTPVSLMFALIGSWLSRDATPYQFFLGIQMFFYGLAIIGILCRGIRFPLFAIPAGFLFLSVMIIRGFLYYLSGEYKAGWEKSPPTD
ncbi:MAG: glycosyltransferase family 2 protein [Opitutae bacterium]|nr:glycosyltransferase family 2 protein [Opitutae bacterium]MBT5691607.1 glycosyltransferase family 2 protein [Opitutae bacterium]